jgi:DnaJ-class molecular chaperone
MIHHCDISNSLYRSLNSVEYRVRKAARVEYYQQYVEGWKQKACSACSGSGYYDHNGSPDCGACDGTGKEIYKPELSMS